MKILVTGADGLLGSNIVRELLARGHSVRALIQPGRPQLTLEGLPIERVGGDILHPETLKPAFEGMEAVIHAAASTRMWPARSKMVRQVIIDGTRNMIQAAAQSSISRMVCVGTSNTFSPGKTKDAPGREGTPYICGHYKMDYMDSKYEAHMMLEAAHRNLGLPVLTVNPTFMIGPYDSTPSSGTMLIRLYRGEVPGYTSGGKNWVHVRDVAVAIANALTMGEPGDSYIVGNENLSYGEFFHRAASVLGVKPPRLRMPRPLVLATGMMGSLGAAITGRPPMISYPMARVGCDGHYYDVSKARKHLVMPATPIETAVEESFAWLKTNGYVEALN